MNLLREKVEWKLFKTEDVKMADAIVDLARDRGKYINYSNPSKDWLIIKELIKIWSMKYPSEHLLYASQNRELTRSRLKDTGANKDNNLRLLANIPNSLIAFIRVIYPEQKLDKKFFREFVKQFPEFRTSYKI